MKFSRSKPIIRQYNISSQSLTNDANDSEFDKEFDIPLPDLIVQLSNMDEAVLLAKYGYRKQKTISEIQQGELFVAEIINNDPIKPKTVVIKKIDKLLHQKRVTIQNKFEFITNKNIEKQAAILHYLTVENNTENIATHINFFESESYYYLVTEHIDSINLKAFVLQCHKYIQNKQLNRSIYHKTLKSLLWQIISTVNWLHNSMKICILDLCPENIMLENVIFNQDANGLVHLNSDIKIKFVDFGVAQNYSNSDEFTENIQHISLDNEQYLAPNIRQQSYYNPKAADLWSFGMIFYLCYFGQYPYSVIEETDFGEPIKGSAYGAVHCNKISVYIYANNLSHFINPKILSLLNGLLNTNEEIRLTAANVMQHRFFNIYASHGV